MSIIFLDIETDPGRKPIVIGILGVFLCEQLVAPDIRSELILTWLPEGARIVTFNGGSFDLPILCREYGLEVKRRLRSMEHIDLLPVARRAGLAGQLRATEVRIGFRAHKREEGHVHARWRAWIERGDRGSLDGILTHNREDLEGTAALYRRLLALGHIAPRFG